jgi:glycosyltransferase involved in cell wall biosynthesis
MRVCIVYDCLFPYTVGGAERWYRNLAERLAQDGHEVTYLTLCQWERGGQPSVPGARVVPAGPRMALYARAGQRRVIPPLVFGAGVLWHLLRHGRRYDVVHTASFPYFSLLAIALLAPLHRYAVVVDWHEVWTRGYWKEYLGPLGGWIGWLVQRVCARAPQRAFCFSRLHAGRLLSEGLRGMPTVLEGEYVGRTEPAPPLDPDPVVVFAGRHIPEKRAPVRAGLGSASPSTATVPTSPRWAAASRATASTAPPSSTASWRPSRSTRHSGAPFASCCPRGGRGTGWS